MKLAHLADSHLDERDPTATLEEQVTWLKWLADHAKKHGAELLLHAGDVFDALGGSEPSERMAATEVFLHWAGLFPVVLVRGNHDVPRDLHYLGKLRAKHPITVMESAGVVQAGAAMIACLPWPRKALLAAAMGATSGADLDAVARDGLKAILQGFRAELAAHDGPKVLLAHVELGGAQLDSGQPVVGRCDVLLHDGDLIDAGAQYGALGHIHKRQRLGTLYYPGSSRQTSFGEDSDKGYNLVTIDGESVHVEHVQGIHRRLVTVEGGVVSATGRLTTENDDNDQEWWMPSQGDALRLTYQVTEEGRAAAAEQAEELKRRWLAAGAHSVKLSPEVVAVHRVRSEAIRTARNSADRVRAYWTARGVVPARADQILSKLSTLEGAA